ncbi:CoA-transferase [Phyllobacterium sp. SB3]|uniref:CoA transferase subunit A n=1 Tax=Phyllobacterium sp. SB3 TaxID=3156073 RepID=UPI0032AEE0C3
MTNLRSKLISLPSAAAMVTDGDRLAIGGFAVYQRPMAFLRELIRQKRKDLTIVGTANGVDVDMLVGAGCVRRIETSYVGLEKRGLALNFRRAVESGAVEIVDYPEILAFDRFRASQENLPFWPCTYLGGTDILTHNKDIKTFTCPITGKTIYAVPPAAPRVGIIQAVAADEQGNVLIPSHHLVPQTLDILLARSCDVLIVAAEQIVSRAMIRKHARVNEIPSYRTAAVVEVPWGAHPTSLLGSYRADDEHMDEYVASSAKPETFSAYLTKYVTNFADHNAYLEQVGVKTLSALREVAL